MRVIQAVVVLTLVGTAAAVAVQLPDIKRYLKMRSMS